MQKGLILAMLAVLFPPARAGQIEIAADPRLELLGVVQLLASPASDPEAFVRRDSDYMKEARRRFARFEKHRAVAASAALHPTRFDYEQRVRALSQLSALPDLEILEQFPRDMIDRAGGSAVMSEWLDTLRAFARESKFAAAFKDSEPGREEGLEAFAVAVRGRRLLEALEAYAGMRLDGSYRLAPTPFLRPGPVNVVIPLRSGGTEILTAIGAETGDPPYFSMNGMTTAFVWHEAGHGLFDTLADRHAERIERSAGLRRTLPDCYGSWHQCVREHIVRAVMLRLIHLEEGPIAAARQRAAEASMNEYPYLEPLAVKLAAYEESRALHPDLAGYYGSLLDVFPAADPRGEPSTDKPAIRFEIDPGIELLSVVLQLADPDFARQYSGVGKSRYARETEAYFAPHAGHPAVGLVASWLRRGLPGAALTELVLQAAPPPGLEIPAGRLHTIAPGNENDLKAVAASLRGFARTSKFSRFFGSHKPWYAAVSSKADRASRGRLSLGRLGRYTSLGFRPRYRFVLAPLLPRAYAARKPALGFEGDEVETYVRPFYFNGGAREDYGFGDFGEGLVHQLLHPVLDPLLDDGRSEVARWDKPLPSGCAASWTACAEEHVILAVSLRAMALEAGERKAAALERRYESSGFPHLGRMTRALRKGYERDGAGAREPLSAFYPQLLEELGNAVYGQPTVFPDPPPAAPKSAETPIEPVAPASPEIPLIMAEPAEAPAAPREPEHVPPDKIKPAEPVPQAAVIPAHLSIDARVEALAAALIAAGRAGPPGLGALRGRAIERFRKKRAPALEPGTPAEALAALLRNDAPPAALSAWSKKAEVDEFRREESLAYAAALEAAARQDAAAVAPEAVLEYLGEPMGATPRLLVSPLLPGDWGAQWSAPDGALVLVRPAREEASGWSFGLDELQGSRAHALARRAAAALVPESSDRSWTAARRENVAAAISLRALALARGPKAFSEARAPLDGKLLQLGPLLAALADYERLPKPRRLSSFAPRLLAALAAPVGRDAAGLRVQAIAEFMAGRLERALALSERAVELGKDDPESWLNLGAVLQSLGRPEKALAAYVSAGSAARARRPARLDLLAEALFAEASLTLPLEPVRARRALAEALEAAPPAWTRRSEAESRLKLLKGD